MKIPIQYAVNILIVAFVLGCVKQSTHEEVLEKLKAKESEKNQLDSFLTVAKEEGSKNKTELKLLTDQLQQTKIEKEEISRKLKNESSSYQSALEKTEVQQKEITELKKHLDEYENGYDRSVSVIKSALQSKDFGLANEKLISIERYHPQNLEDISLKTLVAEVKQKERSEKLLKEKEEKEKLKQANLNKTGEWVVGDYTDSFGNNSGHKYVIIQPVGTFNSGFGSTEKLNIELVVSGNDVIYFKLIQHGGKVPLREKPLSWEMRDSDGQQYQFQTQYRRESGTHRVMDPKTIHSTLLKGGKIQLRGRQSGENIFIAFDVNADFYENAFRIHEEKDKANK